MQPFIVGFYGKSNSGKTTLVTELIEKISNEGFKVVSVKMTDKELSIDTEQKDTWKHSKAGSEIVVFSTQSETSYIVNSAQSMDQIIKNIDLLVKSDIVIVEGCNSKSIPKIRVGDAEERENTIFTFDDFDRVYEYVKEQILRWRNGRNKC